MIPRTLQVTQPVTPHPHLQQAPASLWMRTRSNHITPGRCEYHWAESDLGLNM